MNYSWTQLKWWNATYDHLKSEFSENWKEISNHKTFIFKPKEFKTTYWRKMLSPFYFDSISSSLPGRLILNVANQL